MSAGPRAVYMVDLVARRRRATDVSEPPGADAAAFGGDLPTPPHGVFHVKRIALFAILFAFAACSESADEIFGGTADDDGCTKTKCSRSSGGAAGGPAAPEKETLGVSGSGGANATGCCKLTSAEAAAIAPAAQPWPTCALADEPNLVCPCPSGALASLKCESQARGTCCKYGGAAEY